MDTRVVIDGMVVPQTLLDVVGAGRWIAPPPDSPIYFTVFKDTAADPAFAGLEAMRANRRWLDLIPADAQHLYLGRPDATRPPGDMDPDSSLFLGDLGPDQPFALDYRADETEPRVIYLGAVAQWHEVASDIETFIRLLGI